MRSALLLNAVDPSIGGVLISGHKGTGKSTAVRALAQLLPHINVVEDCPYRCDPKSPDLLHTDCFERFSKGINLPPKSIPVPLVELPLSATEDRIVGTLHVEDALRRGKISFEPGLLAAANRGILYIDEVNLLDDHLVDILLDVAASGINIVEREGISYSHPARFILVGTMNPEEGALRPQFLDRFGLFVCIKSLDSPEDRKEIVQRRIAWERNAKSFFSDWAECETEIAQRIVNARQRLDQIVVTGDIVDIAVGIASEAGAQGHRAEINIVKAARALAALMGSNTIDQMHIAETAHFVLPHRITCSPFNSPDDVLERVDEVIIRVLGQKKSPPHATLIEDDNIDSGYLDEPMQVPGSAAAGSIIFSFEKKTEKIIEPDDYVSPVDIDAGEQSTPSRLRGRKKTSNHKGSGKYTQSASIREGEQSFDIAVDATVRACALRTALKESPKEEIDIRKSDLRKKIRRHPEKTLIVFIVDASDSMGSAERRMAAAKGAALAMLKKVYIERNMISLISFRDDAASIILPPTHSVERARECLKSMPVGGATPLADGLKKARDVVRFQRIKYPGMRSILVVISDGEANVPLIPGASIVQEVCSLAAEIRKDMVHSIVIDTNHTKKQSDVLIELSHALGARYHHIDSLRPGNLLDWIHEEATTF